MKLFFKHLIRGILKRPLQPVIIILTIALSVLVSITAFTMKKSVADEVNLSNEAIYGSSDIVVKLNSNSRSRFMFDTEVESLLSGKANAVGTYELVFSLNDDAVFAKAVDFTEINTVFDFHFTQYGEVKEEEISVSAMITEDLAKKHNISLGEKIELELFGKKIQYGVCAISKSPFFDGSEIIVDITGVMRVLASESTFISVLDGIKPYSAIYIDVFDDENKNECIELLSKSDSYSDKSIIEVSENINRGLLEITLPFVINVCIALSAFLTIVVVFNSIFILSKQRVEENNTFIAIGTKKSLLNFMQYLEIILYWLIGTPIGILISIPVISATRLYLSFKYAQYSLELSNTLFGIFLVLLISLLTVTFFVASREKERKEGKRGALIIALFSAFIILLVFTLLHNGNLRAGAGILSAITVILIVFFATPYLIFKSLTLIFNLIEKGKARGKNIKIKSLYYALKNLKSIDALKNTARLVGSLIVVVLATAMLVGSSHGNLNATKQYFDGDYIVLNATERCYDKISQLESVKEVSQVYQSRANYEKGYLTLVTSSNNKGAFSNTFEIRELPKGNEAIMSKTDARSLNLKRGDEFTIKLDGKSLTLSVKDIVDTGTTAIIVDYEGLGLTPNMILVKAKDGKQNQLLSELTLASSDELATVISAKELRSDKIESNTSILRCANMLLCIILSYALLGIINNQFESYRSRKEELSLYHYAGISKSQIAKMILFELGAVLIIGILVGAFGTIASIISIDEAIAQFNFEVLAYLKYLFI